MERTAAQRRDRALQMHARQTSCLSMIHPVDWEDFVVVGSASCSSLRRIRQLRVQQQNQSKSEGFPKNCQWSLNNLP